MTPRLHTDALRDRATALADDLYELAAALDAGDADADDVHEMYRQLAFVMVELEDAATTHDVLDDTTPQSKAIDEARKAVFYLSKGDGSEALTSLDAAADHAEAAYSDE